MCFKVIKSSEFDVRLEEDSWLYNNIQVVDLWWSDEADIHMKEKIL